MRRGHTSTFLPGWVSGHTLSKGSRACRDAPEEGTDVLSREVRPCLTTCGEAIIVEQRLGVGNRAGSTLLPIATRPRRILAKPAWPHPEGAREWHHGSGHATPPLDLRSDGQGSSKGPSRRRDSRCVTMVGADHDQHHNLCNHRPQQCPSRNVCLSHCRSHLGGGGVEILHLQDMYDGTKLKCVLLRVDNL
jgi:hypothetical protein